MSTRPREHTEHPVVHRGRQVAQRSLPSYNAPAEPEYRGPQQPPMPLPAGLGTLEEQFTEMWANDAEAWEWLSLERSAEWAIRR